MLALDSQQPQDVLLKENKFVTNSEKLVEALAGSHFAAEADNLVEYALSYFPFRGFGNFHNFVMTDDGDRVAVGVKAYALAGNVVYYDGVERLGRQLLAGVFQDVLRFSGKADD